MLTIKILIQLLTIILAIFGAYLVANTAETIKGKMNRNQLRARVFLNESFIKDNWMLLFVGCFFFLMNATVDFNEISGLFIEKNSLELVRDVTILGVLSCSVVSEYKWFKLIAPTKRFHTSFGKSMITFLALPFTRAENGKSSQNPKKPATRIPRILSKGTPKRLGVILARIMREDPIINAEMIIENESLLLTISNSSTSVSKP